MTPQDGSTGDDRGMNARTLLEMSGNIGKIMGVLETIRADTKQLRNEAEIRCVRHEARMDKNEDRQRELQEHDLPALRVQIAKEVSAALGWRQLLIAVLTVAGGLLLVAAKYGPTMNKIAEQLTDGP
jgi:hypothetical protein